MHRLGWMFFLLTSVLWICLSIGKAEGEIKILPSPTGRNVIVDHEGVPERARPIELIYTNYEGRNDVGLGEEPSVIPP